MAMARVQQIFEASSGNPEDAVVNTFHFETPVGGLDEADAHACNGAVAAAYQQGVGGAFLGSRFDKRLTRATPPKLKCYELTEVDGKWVTGSPVAEDVWAGNLPDFAGTAMPSEVAICLSFHGDLTDIPEVVPQAPAGPLGDAHLRARKRGRVYLPVNSQLAVDDASGVARPIAGVINGIVAMGQALMTNAALATAGISWGVFSKTAGVILPVTGGWVDNEFDTQRRRGNKATARTTW